MIYFLLVLALLFLLSLGREVWRWGLLQPSYIPTRVELKGCSNWTIFPSFTRTESTQKSKHYWLIHGPFCDLWVIWEGQR